MTNDNEMCYQCFVKKLSVALQRFIVNTFYSDTTQSHLNQTRQQMIHNNYLRRFGN